MAACFLIEADEQGVIPIHPLTSQNYRVWVSAQDEPFQQWVESSNFKAKPGSFCLVPADAGHVQCVLLGVEDDDDFWSYGACPRGLPEGNYSLSASDFQTKEHYFRACLAWGLGAYQFSAYREAEPVAKLLLSHSVNADRLHRWVESIYFGRDLVNTPADVMNPEQLAATVKALAKECSAKFNVVVGEKLLKQNYPAIYAVGKGGEHEPRLIELNWGNKEAPLLTLVGKGVCFDSGGLDLKPPRGMRLMKKDMSGAAHVLTIARMIMKEQLPVQLRVLIPAVENSVDARSYRPGDVIKTRAGITVEIDNTDAEGRMVLCDALALAVEEQPELIIDFASLTGAASVALGTDIPAFYSNEDDMAHKLWIAAHQQQDPMWLMPLHKPYEKMLKSDIADCVNCSTTGYGGSITAALYLQKFVPDEVPWIHFDATGWNHEPRPGRPKGAEMLAVRAVFAYLKDRYG